MSHTVVFGNYGELIVDRNNGNVVQYKPDDGDGTEYSDIVNVVIPTSMNDGKNIDILFCGLWIKDDSGELHYERPCWPAELDVTCGEAQ